MVPHCCSTETIKGIRDPNIWGPPGGHVEDNETELTCAKRELFEETNYYEKTLLFLDSL